MASIIKWISETVRRPPGDRRLGWGFLFVSGAAAALMALASLMWQQVNHPFLLLAVIAFFLAWGLLLVLHAGPRPKLETRFSSGAPYIYSDGQITRYRIGVYNPGPNTIENVRMELLNITPPPKAGTFSANFPFPVRRVTDPEPKHYERINADGKPLNPHDEERFEPLWFWLSADGRVIVDGLDTNPIQWDGKFEMQGGESWTLRFRISSGQTDPQVVDFVVRREGTHVVMERIT